MRLGWRRTQKEMGVSEVSASEEADWSVAASGHGCLWRRVAKMGNNSSRLDGARKWMH